ncbi:LysE family translocator [Methylobacterium sp. A54F]
MPAPALLAPFLLVILGLAVTPGPNMIHLLSRSIAQGPRAGLISLAGAALGFVAYMLCAALGITALLMTVPIAYDVLRLGGAGYLLYLAWQAVRPGARSPFEAGVRGPSSPLRLFLSGLVTTLLNPKAALVYLALLPQFVDPGRGSVFTQTLVLGALHIGLNVVVGTGIALAAGRLATVLTGRPAWMRAQRWLMGGVLGMFSVRLVAEAHR